MELTAEPTQRPTGAPSASPTVGPTDVPTASPTSSPAASPTNSPIASTIVRINFIGSVANFENADSEVLAGVQTELTKGALSLIMDIIDAVESKRGRKLQSNSPEFNLKGLGPFACPEGLIYADKGDTCVGFTADVVFASDFVLRVSANDFRDMLIDLIDNKGKLYDVVLEANTSTNINGIGNPGNGRVKLIIPEANVAESNEVEVQSLSSGAVVGIVAGSLLIVVLVLALMAISKRKSDEENKVREFAGEAAADEEAPDSAKITKDITLKEEVADDEKSEEQEAPPTALDNDDENSVSSGSSGWSETNDSQTTASDIVDENDPEKKSVASTLAAMGVASTVTSQLVSSPALPAMKSDDETEENLFLTG